MRVESFQLGVVKVDLSWGVVIIIQELIPLHPMKWMNPLEIELYPRVQELHFLKAARKGHVPAIRNYATLISDFSLQLIILELQRFLVG